MSTQPTDEQLRHAWRVCRARSWPTTFEETMADPMRARLVTTCAIGLARKPRAPSPENFDLTAPPGRVSCA